MSVTSRHILRFRLIPATMLLCVLFLGIKIGDILEDTQHLHKLMTNPAYAEEQKAAAAPVEKPKEETKETAKTDAKPAEGEAAKTEEANAKPKVSLPGESDVAPEDKKEFSQIEIDLLQSLSKRREEIERWAEEVKLKDNGLQATEVRLDQKLAELKSLRTQMEGLLVQYNEKENAKIKSLIKIYENMKPKDAARIFDELDMPTLLMVVDKMSERKAAPILANMSPVKAKDLTVQLAEQRKTSQPIADSAAEQTAPGAQ